MKTNSFKNGNRELPKVIYLLQSVDCKRRIGILKIREDKPQSHWLKLKISLSPLLAYSIFKEKNNGLLNGDQLVGTQFKSTLDSDKYHENPFRLIEFIPDERSDIPHNYHLELVFEGLSKKIELKDVFNNPFTRYKNRTLMPSEYIRFQKCVVTKKLSECRNNIVIAK